MLYASARDTLGTGGLGYIHKQPLLEVDFVLALPQELARSSVGGKTSGRGSKTNRRKPSKETSIQATIHQDPSSLASEAGNTSAVAWRISLHLAKLLLWQSHFPTYASPILDLEKLAACSVLELGSGTGRKFGLMA